ncbi:hypothetical protein [Marinoscillum pacificum]|uniref:hypothetical protein n=1 Tax=Marinoscillum pacificum TaxID=392723 RepID=UPI002157E1C9|nr:hypothetical protein [Marinoscillum pacificum]
MKTLRYIENFLTLLQVGALASMLLGLYLTYQMKEGSQQDFFIPHLEFNSGRNLLQSELTNFLNSESHMVFEGPESADLQVSRITINTEATTTWRWGFAGFFGSLFLSYYGNFPDLQANHFLHIKPATLFKREY